MNRISKEKDKLKSTLVKILYINIVNSVKTVIMFLKNKRNIILSALVAIFFASILYFFINRVVENSKLGVEERFSVENNNEEVLLKNDVAIKEETLEKRIETNVMSVIDNTETSDSNIKKYFSKKINGANDKIIKKIEKIKKEEEEEEAKKAEKEAKKAEESQHTSEAETSNQEKSNSDINSESSSGSASEIPSDWMSISMIATAYDLSVESCGKVSSDPAYGITASGTRATKGRTIAVDPSVIALGTEVYIDFGNSTYDVLDGYYIAEDTGGAIKGNKIDIFVGDNARSYALSFGIQNCTVYLK